MALLALQYRLWVSGSGMREVWRLEQAIATQQQRERRSRGAQPRARGRSRDLKDGHAALEERARTDLGMIGANETFYQVVPPEASNAPAAQTPQRTAQAEAQ